MVKLTPNKTKIVLNGVDVSNYVFVGSTKKSKNQPVVTGTLNFRRSITDVLSISDSIVGKTVTIQRGFSTSTERYIFRGEVVSYRLRGSLYEFNISNKLYAAVRLNYDYTYNRNTDTSAGVGSEIVKDLLTQAGLSYSSTSIVSTGTDSRVLMRLFTAKGPILDSIKNLCNIYGYTIFYKESDDYCYFVPKGYNTTSTVLTTGTTIINRIQWNNTGEDLVNNLTVIGGQQLDWTTESFTGPVTEVTLTAQPVDTDITVGGVHKDRGVNSSDPKDFYVEPGSRKIIFTVSSSTIVVNYSYNVPVKVNVSDYDSESTYVRVDESVTDNTILNTDDAELFGNAIITDNSDLLTSAPLKVISNNDLELNDYIKVVDNVNVKTVNVIVSSIEYSFPYKADSVEVGRVPFNEMDWVLNTSKSINDLQRQLSSDTDVNVQLINNNDVVDVVGYTKVEESLLASNGLYWNSATQGTWNTFYWNGTSTAELYRISSLIPVNGVIFEDFYTAEFKDTTSTTTGDANLTTSLVAYYALDGNSNDSTGLYNGVDTSISYSAGKLGQCAVFNGTTSKITIADAAALDILGDITIAAWISYTSGVVIISKATSAGATATPFWFGMDGDGYFIFSRADASSYTSTDSDAFANISGTGWHHVAVTHNITSNEVIFYLDGVKTGASKTNTRNPTANGNPVLIGARADGYSPFKGNIDEVYLSSRVLTPTEISELYNSNAGLAYPFYWSTSKTTATWGTTGAATFTSGQTATSTYYLKDLLTTSNYMTVTATYSGTLTLTVSGDGNTWESFANGAEKTMTTPFNYIYWRAIETGGGTATLNSIKINYR